MKTIHRFLLALPCALAVLVACGQNPNPTSPTPTPDPIPTPPSQISVFGAFEATLDAGSGTASGITQNVTPNDGLTFGTATFINTTDTTTKTRYLKAIYPVTNNTAGNITNLTLYALNRSSGNLGGTGMKSLSNFVSTTSGSDAAQAMKPTHGMTNSSTITSGQEDFQAFQTSELLSIKTTAISNSVMNDSDTVLEYGFVARYCTTNCGGANPSWSRSIPAGQTGQVTIAYKLPNASITSSYKFTATFVLSTESTTRVTRSREETTSMAQSRATAFGATQVVLIGSDTDTSSVGTTIRIGNVKTSTNPNYLYPVYNITLQFSNNVSSGFKADFNYAINIWQDIITADLPDVAGNFSPCGNSVPGWSSVSNVDDLLIFVDVAPIDGPFNILGSAGICGLRNGSLLPTAGIMEFDSADFVAGSTRTRDVILHEMGHVLGIGGLWKALGLVTGDTTSGCDTTFYTGTHAKAEWAALGGTGNIPLETTGGPGTCEAHWKESNFDNEIMTGYRNSNVENKLSRMTIGALKDVGYSVNYTFADAYAPLSLTKNPISLQNQSKPMGEELLFRWIGIK